MRPSETFESNLYKDIQYHWPVFREPFKVPGDEDVGPEPGLLHHHLTARGPGWPGTQASGGSRQQTAACPWSRPGAGSYNRYRAI